MSRRAALGPTLKGRIGIATEFAFIDALRAIATDPAARGLDDDAAVIPFGGEVLVATHDAMVEGVHCLPLDHPGSDPADVAWKLVASNLSDLAAKGAAPVGVLLGHMLGDRDERFVEGLREILGGLQVPLLGGDTVRGSGDARSWGLTALGRATHVPVPARDGASPGEAIYVTGPLGRAMLGFEALRDGTDSDTSAYRRPIPRLGEGMLLAPLVTAMMDISDGLLLDAFRMGQASGATLSVETAMVPVADPDRRDECLRWGDDYELLFTVPERTRLPVPAIRIGTVGHLDGAALALDGTPVFVPDGLGYQH